MTKTINNNYANIASPGSTFNRRISQDSDTFARNDVDSLGEALDDHDHSNGKGLPLNSIPSGGLTITGNTTITSGAGSTILTLSGSATTGVNQYGMDITPTFSSAATTSGNGIRSTVTTAAAAFTMVTGYCFLANSPSIGAGSAITTQNGLSISNQGASGITNAIGVNVAQQSGASGVNAAIVAVGETSIGQGALATTATTGFVYISAGGGGAFTGTPANLAATGFSNKIPIAFDIADGRLYAYYSGAWHFVAFT